MVLQLSAAFADDPVTITEKTQWVQTRTEQKRYCGKNPNTEACTHFVDYRPAFVCMAREHDWTIDGSAQVTAMIILRRPGTILDKREILQHERLHLTDVRESLEQYILQLEQQRFASEAECRSAAEGETQTFKQRLRDFALASTAKRD